MAADNEYVSYHKCHIVPWKFIEKVIGLYATGPLTRAREEDMLTFINDLAVIHDDASFYDALDPYIKHKLGVLTTGYQNKAKEALGNGNMEELAKTLNSIPSNLYPCDPHNNLSIQDNLDPPRKGTKSARSGDATKQAKALYEKYHQEGLDISLDINKTPDKAKSSDKPPNSYIVDAFVNIK